MQQFLVGQFVLVVQQLVLVQFVLVVVQFVVLVERVELRRLTRLSILRHARAAHRVDLPLSAQKGLSRTDGHGSGQAEGGAR